MKYQHRTLDPQYPVDQKPSNCRHGSNDSNSSSEKQVVRVWAEVVGGLKTTCIKIGYSEPTRAESREGSSIPPESSRVT